MADRKDAPDQDDSRRSTVGSLGAGSEATAGVHADQPATDGANAAGTDGTDAVTGRGAEGSADRAGSEPLGREREHKPSYGGEGGKPRTSSDQREPLNPS
jgi:hypothetical protein